MKKCSKICFQTLGQFIFCWHVSIEIKISTSGQVKSRSCPLILHLFPIIFSALSLNFDLPFSYHYSLFSPWNKLGRRFTCYSYIIVKYLEFGQLLTLIAKLMLGQLVWSLQLFSTFSCYQQLGQAQTHFAPWDKSIPSNWGKFWSLHLFLSITGTSPNIPHVLKLTLNYQIGATP